MLDFLTDDKELREKIYAIVNSNIEYSFFEKIFSIKNIKLHNRKIKIISILGIQIKINWGQA